MAFSARLLELLVKIRRKDQWGFFQLPVSREEVRPGSCGRSVATRTRLPGTTRPGLQVPDYHTIVKEPMDFATMETRLRAGSYGTLDALASDFRLICSNAMLYNPEDSDYYKEAVSLLAAGNKLIDAEAARQLREQELALARKVAKSSTGTPAGGARDSGVNTSPGPAAAPHAGSKRARDAAGEAAPVRQSTGRASKAAAAAHLALGDDSSSDGESGGWDAPPAAAAPPARASKAAAGAGGGRAAKRAAREESDRSGASSGDDNDGGVSMPVVCRTLRGITVHVGVPFRRAPRRGGGAAGGEDGEPPVAPPAPEDYDPEEDAWVCAVCDDGSADATGNALVQCGACAVVVHQVSWVEDGRGERGLGAVPTSPPRFPAAALLRHPRAAAARGRLVLRQLRLRHPDSQAPLLALPRHRRRVQAV